MGSGRKRYDPDAEYKTLLSRSVPGSGTSTPTPAGTRRRRSKPQSAIRQTPCSKAEVKKEWRYLLKPAASKKVKEQYSQYLHDPDAAIDWSHVSRIIVDSDIFRDEVDRCPICLESPPIAPRLSKCGHIYCLVCIIKYISIFGSQCPLCLNNLYVFKPVVYVSPFSIMSNKVGQSIQLKLHSRSKNGLIVFPLDEDQTMYDGSSECPRDHDKVISPVFRSKAQHLLEILIEEKQLILDSSEPDDHEYVNRAVAQINSDIADLASMPEEAQEEDKSAKGTLELYYYFYQPEDQTRTFLDNLDIKILLAEYKQFSDFPLSLQPSIQTIKFVTVDKSLRGKSKYLDNLALGTEIRLLGCDWTGIISDKVLQKFKNELKERIRPTIEKHENSSSSAESLGLKVATSYWGPFALDHNDEDDVRDSQYYHRNGYDDGEQIAWLDDTDLYALKPSRGKQKKVLLASNNINIRL